MHEDTQTHTHIHTLHAHTHTHTHTHTTHTYTLHTHCTTPTHQRLAHPLKAALPGVLVPAGGPEHGPEAADGRQLDARVRVVLGPALGHLLLLGLAHQVHGLGPLGALGALRGEGRHARVDGLAGRGAAAGVAAPGGARAELQRVDGALDVGDLPGRDGGVDRSMDRLMDR